jgi:hypothetical protein
MNHHCRRSLLLAPVVIACTLASASTLDALSSKDAAAGLRAALTQGIDVAVAQLGAKNGFLKDPKVAIPLHAPLNKAESGLRMLGMGGEADQLKATMNHAAEQAVAQAEPIFKHALQQMTLADAKNILAGGDGAATAYFRKTTSTELTAKFKPIVAAETAKLGLAAQYDEYAGKVAQFGLIPAQDANLNDYVTAKALDGLFSRIAEEEHQIRADPMGQASALIKKVFGSL